LEDNPNDRQLIAELLRDGGVTCDILAVDSRKDLAIYAAHCVHFLSAV
jgi:hypothetical protein